MKDKKAEERALMLISKGASKVSNRVLSFYGPLGNPLLVFTYSWQALLIFLRFLGKLHEFFSILKLDL